MRSQVTRALLLAAIALPLAAQTKPAVILIPPPAPAEIDFTLPSVFDKAEIGILVADKSGVHVARADTGVGTLRDSAGVWHVFAVPPAPASNEVFSSYPPPVRNCKPVKLADGRYRLPVLATALDGTRSLSPIATANSVPPYGPSITVYAEGKRLSPTHWSYDPADPTLIIPAPGEPQWIDVLADFTY
jgi:hypothetical protein